MALEARCAREAEERMRIEVQLGTQAGRLKEQLDLTEQRAQGEARERGRLDACLQKEAERISVLESGLAHAEAEVNEERRRNVDLLAEIDRLRRENAMLEERALASNNAVDERGREVADLMREVDILRLREADLLREVDNGRRGMDELKYMNEDQLKTIHSKESEIDCLKSQVLAAKEDHRSADVEVENLRSVVNDLEERNKRYGESINAIMYTKAAEYKERTLQALKRGDSPNRRAAAEPSTARLQRILKDKPSGVEAIASMVRLPEPGSQEHLEATPGSRQVT